MKPSSKSRSSKRCLLAVVLTTLASSTAVHAAAPALNGRLELRPLTPQEIKAPSLVGQQVANGLSTIGIGQPAYLDALVNVAVPSADITNVTWALISAPAGSKATLVESPLGTNVPPYKMVDRLDAQVAGRKMLRPDVAGQYEVKLTISTASSGTAELTQTITAGTYMGLNTCALCHSGGIGADDKVSPWSQTHHAGVFTREIDGGADPATSHYSKNCLSCHTVGYDANTNAVNGGFDDIAKNVGWVFPTNFLTGSNWAAVPASLKNVANIQCENCHGPGSEHAFSLGDTNKISVTLGAGACSQCHDSMTHHFRSAEWNNSRHAIAVEETEAGCARCHSAQGLVNFAAGKPAVATPYEVVTCSACHEPHDVTNPHQVRTVANVKLMDNKTVVTEGGLGKLCMQCHISRRDAESYAQTTAPSNRYGPHHGPQTDMLVGANAVTYGKVIPSSAHREVAEDACVTCHMQENEGTPSFTHAGGHTFNMKWVNGTNAYEMTEACVECHGEIEDFNFKRQDFDGNGVIEGVQTEVRGLLNQLALLLPPVGVTKTNHSATNLGITASWTNSPNYRKQLKAAYNYLFVVEDGSYGIHNLSYAVGLLKASISDLTGDSNGDGLPDAWQSQFFGSCNDLRAAPNASPAGDGVPNWLKYSLGLDPMVAGLSMPGGVVWANGKGLVNPPIDPGLTNTIAIYNAAEVVFNTEQGKSYQIQGISGLGGTWENLGSPIPGTGTPVSYVTPTRANAQQFFRVVATP
jgi:cytochrome c1